MLITKELLEEVGVKVERPIDEYPVLDVVSAQLAKTFVRLKLLALVQQPWNRKRYDDLAKRVEELADEVQSVVARKELEEIQAHAGTVEQEADIDIPSDIPF